MVVKFWLLSVSIAATNQFVTSLTVDCHVLLTVWLRRTRTYVAVHKLQFCRGELEDPTCFVVTCRRNDHDYYLPGTVIRITFITYMALVGCDGIGIMYTTACQFTVVTQVHDHSDVLLPLLFSVSFMQWQKWSSKRHQHLYLDVVRELLKAHPDMNLQDKVYTLLWLCFFFY